MAVRIVNPYHLCHATLAAIGHRSTDPVPLESRIGLDRQAGQPTITESRLLAMAQVSRSIDFSSGTGKAGSLGEFLSMVARTLAAAQQRSGGVVLAVFEGSSRDAELQGLQEQMVTQREVTAAWIVRGMTRLAPLRPGLGTEEAVDVVWLLMDPAVFIRLTRQRRWDAGRYRRWIADALARLIVTGIPDGQDKH